MGKLKPIGSEKLTGQDKVNRIMEIARYGEVTKNDNYHTSTNSFSQKASDGNTYAIIQEKDGYYLKCGINESELDYVSGGMNKKKDRFKSYSAALKRMNLVFKPLNEEYNEGKGHSMYDEVEEQEKFVLNVADEDGEEEMDMNMDMGTDEMEDDEMDVDMDMDMVDDEMDVEVDGEVDMEGFMKSIQKLTGKLGQKLRDSGEELGSADIKYVLNSIISAVDLETLDDEDRDDVLDRFEDDEASYGDDEEMDMDVDMGDEELDMGMEDEDMGMEDEEEIAMESLKKRVGSLLESYITEKNEKKKTKSIDPKQYLKSRLSSIIKENTLVKKAVTVEQELTIKKLVKKYKNINLKKNSKNGDVILESPNKKIVVKKNGSIR
jgi:hypothetical protein|tara:strand:+ start:289 stop:1422 length:1134 start_codon:yes stop_codon:yes gene_type:complete